MFFLLVPVNVWMVLYIKGSAIWAFSCAVQHKLFFNQFTDLTKCLKRFYFSFLFSWHPSGSVKRADRK